MGFQATVVQKKLEEAGFEPKLAFGITAVLERDVVGDVEARLVSREYLDARMAEVRADIAEWRAETKSEIAETKSEVAALRADTKTEISDLRATTRTEIAELRTETRTEIAALRAEMRTEIGALKADLIKWMVTLTFGSTLAVVIAMLRLFK